MAIKEKVIGGFKWNTLSVVVNTVVQLLRVSVLSRILDTSDFGLMAIALMVIAFTEIFSELGFTVPIIHKQDITKTQLSSVYWMNVIVSVIIYVVLFAVAPLLAAFYKEPSLVSIIRVVGVVVIINGFGKVFQTLKTKNLEFRFISIVAIVTSVLGLVITYLFAINGFGVYSLVYGVIAQNLIRQGVYSIQGLSSKLVSFELSLREIKDFIRIGGNQVGAQILDFIASKVDIIILGKTIGMDNLGIYNLAKELVQKCYALGVSLTSRVMAAALAQLQSDFQRLKSTYLNYARILSLFFGPVFIAMFIFSPEISAVMYGDKAELVAPVLKWLSLFGFFNCLISPSSSIQLALGRTDISLLWTFVISVTSAGITILAGLWGFEMVVYAQVLIGFICFILSWLLVLNKLLRVSIREYLNTYGFSLLSSLSLIIILGFLRTIGYEGWLWALVCGLLMVVVYFIELLLFEKKTVISLKEGLFSRHFFKK